MRFKGERILVTGGAGFVGSHITKRLISEGAFVCVLDDLSNGKKENLPESKKVEFIKGSVTDFSFVREIVKDTDIIIHEAVRTIEASIKNPEEDFDVNIGGTLKLLLAMKETKKAKRFIYASSVSIYGNPRYLPVNEDDIHNVLTPYSASKLAGENYCMAFYESFGLSTTILRYSNIYGTFQGPNIPYTGVVTKFFRAALCNAPIKIHGDGEQTRDFTYVEDVVEATLLAAISPKAEGRIYNVGTGREVSINFLADRILEICGSSIKPIHIDRRDIDNVRRRVVNIDRIRKELRWIPKYTLEEGLRKTGEWLKDKCKEDSETSI